MPAYLMFTDDVHAALHWSAHRAAQTQFLCSSVQAKPWHATVTSKVRACLVCFTAAHTSHKRRHQSPEQRHNSSSSPAHTKNESKHM